MLPALALDVRFGLGLTEIVMLLGVITYFKSVRAGLSLIPANAKWIVVAFFINFLVAMLTISWRGNEFNFLDNPVRQLLVMSAIFLIPLVRPMPMYFWTGLIVGCVSAFCLAIFQVRVLHLDRPTGAHQAILFGDIAMVMGSMSLAAVRPLIQSKKEWCVIFPCIAFVAGVAASALSGTRGGWAAIVLALIPLSYSVGLKRLWIIISICLTGLAAVAFSATVLNSGVVKRTSEAYFDIQKYLNGDVNTSVGMRFEMWRGATQLFLENPFLGVGKANFRQGLNQLADRGVVNSGVRIFPHAHNEMLNELATSGAVGGITLFLLYAVPLRFFFKARRHEAQRPFATAGILLVLGYILFGLTEVLFSQHFGAIFYAAFVAVLVGFCVAQGRELSTS